MAKQEGKTTVKREYRSGMREQLFTYSVSDASLAHGTSLGNAHAWAASKGTGAIQSLFSTDVGLEVTGSLTTGFFAGYNDLSEDTTPDKADQQTIVRLAPLQAGEFVLHPAYQEHTYDLIGNIHAKSTFFLPNTGFEDEAVVIEAWEVENRSLYTQTVLAIPSLYLPGNTGLDIHADYDDELGAIIFRNESHPDWVRAFGAFPKPSAYFAGHDCEEASDPKRTLPNKITGTGDLTAAIQMDITLNPGERKKFAFVVAFTPKGKDAINAVFRGASDYEQLQRKTVERYREVLTRANVMTPDGVINQGVQWCKANMLRVTAHYPTGIAFTNDPGKSSNVVARDAAWFIYGNDYILPEASCHLLKQFADRQESSGMIVEYYNALTGETEDYGLNINDDTPLFILACAHHLNCTGHKECMDHLYPIMCKAADYIISQEDSRGLVWCTADGTNAQGIIGWRNIIPNKTISGAVTEVNAEAYSALRALCTIASLRGDDAKAEYYRDKAHDLREAINTHLKNPKNGMYYLNIDLHGNPIAQVTADEVFPLIFGIADEDSSRRIRLRLSNSDFMTEAGLRTISSQDPQYTPDTFSGLLGGVWPGVTWWYAMASVEYDPGLMVESLKRSYEQYVVRPPAYNTVPGQFSEWFGGESLVNHGMRLSPWEPPRFLWAMIEGAVGLDTTGSAASVSPRIPDEWKWLSVRNLSTSLGHIDFFAAKIQGELIIYTSSKFLHADKVDLYDRELTERLSPVSPDTVSAAFSRDNEIVVCLGNTSSDKKPAPFYADEILDAEKDYKISICQSETGRWVEMGTHRGETLRRQSIEIEPQGFAVFRFST